MVSFLEVFILNFKLNVKIWVSFHVIKSEKHDHRITIHSNSNFSVLTFALAFNLLHIFQSCIFSSTLSLEVSYCRFYISVYEGIPDFSIVSPQLWIFVVFLNGRFRCIDNFFHNVWRYKRISWLYKVFKKLQ